MVDRVTSKRSSKVEAWLEKEVKAQELRYQKIIKRMEALSPEREKWVEEFLGRIQTRGFNVHSSILKKIDARRIPKRPKRKLQVVY